MAENSILTEHLNKYPMMQTMDGIKLALQSVYGAAHFGGTREGAVSQIQKEMSAFEGDPSLFLCEDIGEHVRLELKNPLVRDLGEELIASLFILSAEEDKASAGEEKLAELTEIFREIEAVFSPSEEEKKLMESLLESYSRGTFESVSHSDIYKKNYAPSYRVLSKKHFRLFPILEAVKSLSETKERVVVALDGRCASGKSTAAEILSKSLDAPVIKTDDFFLPFERKTPSRLAETAGNIDYERFFAEVIPNLRENKNFTYKAYSCSDGTFYPKTVPASKIMIVEGVYSMRPEFTDSYDIKVFFNVSEKTQLSRLAKRNPKLLDRFKNEWIPMEEKYFSEMKIKELCDIVIGEC
ncbi:MAG: hypothetical protein E7660_07685 [Ruminococcaceae bacterium]|nr:hypothetical protein [Oscillospiraceae bacterium]